MSGRLDSWKEIAAYLKRDSRTVKRWEKREGLPVHRHLHEARASVFAFRSELDAWWQNGHACLRVEGKQAVTSAAGTAALPASNNGAGPSAAVAGASASRSAAPAALPELRAEAEPGKRWKWLGLVAALAAIVAVPLLLPRRHAPPLAGKDTVVGHSHPELTERQLTSNPSEDPVRTSAISPYGKYLAYIDETGLLVRSLDSGETRPIFLPADFPAAQVDSILWLPDGGRLLVTRGTPEGSSLWVVAVLGQAPPRLFRQHSDSPAISPDGKSISFLSGAQYQPQDLWVSGINGETPHKLAAAIEYEFYPSPTWSPDGKWIAYFHKSLPESGPVRFTIEAQPTSGGASKLLVSDAALGGPLTLEGSCLYWSRDWRLIFGVADSPSRAEPLHSLWEVHVDPVGLRPSQPPQQLTTFRHSTFAGLSASYDGRRLALLEYQDHDDVYLTELQSGKLIPPRRFTLDNHDSLPDLWTRDSQSILFVSNRNGKNELFEQGLSAGVPQKLESSATADIGTSNGLTSDGKWLLFWEKPPRASGEHPQLPVRLMRHQIGGGPAEQVLEMPYREGMTANLRCPFRSAKPCVLEELGGKDWDNVLFFSVDPIHGKGHLLGSIQITTLHWIVGWALSPVGSQIAIVGHKDRIEILNLSTRAWQAITVDPGWGDFQSLSWDGEGKGFLVTTVLPGSFDLVHVTLLGKVQPLLNNARWRWIFHPLPSPDGRYVAFQAETFNSNVWLLENF